MNRSFNVVLCGLAVSAGLMPLLIRLARRLGMVDNPTHRKTHVRPTPYLGGVGIVAGFTLAPLLFIYAAADPSRPVDPMRLAVILGPALAMSILGVFDDKRPVSARIKLLVQILASATFVFFGFRLEIIKIPGMGSGQGLWDWESIPLTVGWMLAVINGLNLVDGIDGLAGSVASVIFAAIAVMALNLPHPDHAVAIVALAALGATLGFLIFNWSPAKIYMGDAGSLASGTLAATLLLALGQSQLGGTIAASGGVTVDEPYPYQFAKITLVALYPILEIVLSIVRRLLSGKPIGSADKNHIHHRLIRWGWSAGMICGAAILISAVAASTVIAAQIAFKGVASLLLLCDSVLIVLLLHCCGFLEMLRPKSIQGSRPHFLIANHFMSMQRIKLGLAQNLGEVAALAEQTCIEFGIEKYSMILETGKAGEKPFDLDWNKPVAAHGSLLLASTAQTGAGMLQSFSDKVALASGSLATWSFEPHFEEEEIDIEYRVLMSEFMRQALGRAEYFYRHRPPPSNGLSAPADSSRSVSSTELRRRKNISQKVYVAPTDPVGVKDPAKAPDHTFSILSILSVLVNWFLRKP